MNQKEKYTAEAEAQPEYLHEVTVLGRKLTKGQHAELSPQAHRKQKRDYEFRYAERVHNHHGEETLLLVFYGPVRSNRQHFRYAREHEVLRVRGGKREPRKTCGQEDCEYHIEH